MARRTRTIRILLASALAAAGLTGLSAGSAQAAGEQVNIWLTTTDDAGGRHVTRGLQPQTPLTFQAGSGGSGTSITVDENTRFQTFTGGGASFTDTAAWLMKGSGALSQATRDETMKKLFSPTEGIGLSFVRNPMGGSDLARFGYTYDDVPAGQTDPSLARFSIAHDLADVLPLTKQAKQLNPALTTMASPWTAPAWMKDSGQLNGGWLKSEYYGAYANYFVKYLQAYRDQGIPVDYVTAQNEPTCCDSYPSMSWNGSGLAYFTKSELLPKLQAAGLPTKVMAHDWNWDTYDAYAAPTVDDAAVRSHPNFGGVAWHGYGGNISKQTEVHNRYPQLDAFQTEHSGGTWIANQQREDMSNIIDYTRNWAKSVTKWSLAVDQNRGPHNGGCGVCDGLITVHNGDGRHGQVDYTIEYYTMGHLTKFVKPGAHRIASTASTAVPNVAWRNPDGSKALIAYNDGSAAQTITVNWGGRHATYSLPGKTSATFTWSGTQADGADASGSLTGLGGKCLDVAGGSSADGTAVQLWDCNGSTAQRWTVKADGTVQALGKCLDVTGASTANGAKVQLYGCNGSGAQQWRYESATGDLVNVPADKCLDVSDHSTANGARAQIWACTGAANQKWRLQG
ncbi:ricin-type beta-trefoil lectin domain protein [Streptomyces lunaelactis]|uniref:ricin-type beta-trefoil lectin domain protein n=1 Tax=Streptomyces lunaelactis TaxID=1535768 RepID=UPI001584933C|nr:ricin-type beta-trefoil lectin domain protein [Streptomyces lunaelactis]NUJ99709.1 ricin-type beta-trefoil lectin domain protein [Streptomyces lunaelactis]NUK14615.1 ricin-type beta-trefoil lectin domain protein [Streptomyces lunaelactis]NUK35343.1 ricin-type beta-trefoil lectin domain protein [Streptomyces lunaelactis]NUK41965.1 ricin-type beta-trefoil lectin domain protein [Streptomyces lunaelactis]NUK50210.1 ricin-type beta-trefoil lectin domain protein [Streptomyces lunaelactis]